MRRKFRGADRSEQQFGSRWTTAKMSLGNAVRREESSLCWFGIIAALQELHCSHCLFSRISQYYGAAKNASWVLGIPRKGRGRTGALCCRGALVCSHPVDGVFPFSWPCIAWKSPHLGLQCPFCSCCPVHNLSLFDSFCGALPPTGSSFQIPMDPSVPTVPFVRSKQQWHNVPGHFCRL